jgi:hypothetical protein
MPRPPHSPWLELPNNIWDEYNLWSSSLFINYASNIPFFQHWV